MLAAKRVFTTKDTEITKFGVELFEPFVSFVPSW
jgi:hypothetical protein